jgi:hypothetical protein
LKSGPTTTQLRPGADEFPPGRSFCLVCEAEVERPVVGGPLGPVGAVDELHEAGRFVEHGPHIGLGQRADALARSFPGAG